MREPTPLDHQLLLDAIDGSPETHIVYGVGDDLHMGDPNLLEPAAPMLIDNDEEEDLVD